MTSQNELKECIVNWIHTDDELKKVQESAKRLRTLKKEYTDKLTELMKSNQLDCIETGLGNIHYKQRKTKAPINKKHLLRVLTEYYNNKPEQAQQMTEYILETREEKVKDVIVKKNK